MDSVDTRLDLQAAMPALTRRQQLAVFLHLVLGCTQGEAAHHLGISRSTFQSHLDNGLQRLRKKLVEGDSAR
jgi:DNA-directed RNA polymerase specialized sigma24 family protein